MTYASTIVAGTRYVYRGVLRAAADFVKGVLIGTIVVLVIWLMLG